MLGPQGGQIHGRNVPLADQRYKLLFPDRPLAEWVKGARPVPTVDLPDQLNVFGWRGVLDVREVRQELLTDISGEHLFEVKVD